MSMLPPGNYTKAVIHDNFEALYRFAESNKQERLALGALIAFNGRFVAFEHNDVAFVSTGMGSAQTNCLVESLKEKNCQAVIKVGTCSALDSKLKEGDVIVPYGAVVDEGATYWRKVKKAHDQGEYEKGKAVAAYVTSKQIVLADNTLRRQLIHAVANNKLRARLKSSTEQRNCVWSVDSYDCFDGSYKLYSQINGLKWTLNNFFTGQSINDINIVGVEMECSALFASAHQLGIAAAAIIVVSRDRKRLLWSNVLKGQRSKYDLNRIEPRKVRTTQEAELNALYLAVKTIRQLP